MTKIILRNLPIVALILLSFTQTSCNPQNTLARRLVGQWQVTSYLLDGKEEIGNTIQNMEFEFQAYYNGQGNFSFRSIGMNDSLTLEKGIYKLNEDGDQVELWTEGDPVNIFDVWVSRRELGMVTDFGSADREYLGEKQ